MENVLNHSVRKTD